MGNIDFEMMDKSKRVTRLYKSMWEKNQFVKEANIAKTFVDEKETKRSNNSYSFEKLSEEKKDKTLIREFKITNSDEIEEFGKKYKLACSGAGNEGRRITTLHSSSLCALLFFYNVEKKPITLTIEGEEIEFNYSTFEFKNPVINEASNMDVVLVNEDKKIVLFLESKFAEYYLSSGKSNLISCEYLNKDKCRYGAEIYNCVEDELGLVIEPGIEKKKLEDGTVETKVGFYLKSETSANYLEGIKQMISHYVGVRRRLSEMTECDDEKVAKVLNSKDSRVYLGEILFDGFDIPDTTRSAGSTTILNNYKDTYTKLAKVMNKVIGDSNKRFRVLEEDFGYKELAEKNKDKIAKSILEFYNFN